MTNIISVSSFWSVSSSRSVSMAMAILCANSFHDDDDDEEDPVVLLVVVAVAVLVVSLVVRTAGNGKDDFFDFVPGRFLRRCDCDCGRRIMDMDMEDSGEGDLVIIPWLSTSPHPLVSSLG